jgi:thiol-disulfide isomerase/thioredoxin
LSIKLVIHMKRILLIILLTLLPLSLYSQSDTLYFSDVIKIGFKKYKKESDRATRRGDDERAKFLFDSLVKNHLAGTQFDNFTFKKANGSKFKLSSIKKPVMLITFSSWCVPSNGEIPAINKLAQKYGKDVKIIVLFWDKRHNIKKIKRKFNRNITVCYAHESYKNDAPMVSALKHKLGFPTTFFLDETLKVVDIRRCGMKKCPKKTPYTEAYAINYNSYLDGMGTILLNKELQKEMLATK